MQPIKTILYILVFAFFTFSCSKDVNDLEKESIEEIITFTINKKSFPLPPPPIFKGDSIINGIDEKTIDSLKAIDLTVAIYPIINSLTLNDRNLSDNEVNKTEEEVINVSLKSKINIEMINELSQHNVIFADTIILQKSKDWKEYDLLFYFSKISLSSNFNSAKISVGISRSALWGKAYDIFLKKEKSKKWIIEKTIEKEIW